MASRPSPPRAGGEASALAMACHALPCLAMSCHALPCLRQGMARHDKAWQGIGKTPVRGQAEKGNGVAGRRLLEKQR